MVRTLLLPALVLLLMPFPIVPGGSRRAQVPGAAGHEHMAEVACRDVPPGEKRPEYGCFNVGTVTGLHFSQAAVYWHLRGFPTRKAAEAAKSATGIVVEEEGRVWLWDSGPETVRPVEVSALPSSAPCSFLRQIAMLRSSRTLSCGPETVPECIHTRGPKAGSSWRASSVWRPRPGLTELALGEP